MKKPMKVMLICLTILFGGIFCFKAFQALMIKHFLSSMKNIPTISTITVEKQDWQQELTAAGSLRATRGVDVTTESAGLVRKIYFTPGALVKEGTVLVQLDADPEIAQWHSLQANAELAQSIYQRDKLQYKIGAISKVTLDTDAAEVKSKQALSDQEAAIVAEKTIRAPFTGRLGVCQVNPGQFLNAGSKIVSLQAFDPIYVDFYVPQQDLAQLQVGQKVRIQSNAFPGKDFYGLITTIDPSFDPSTRNVEIEATFANAKQQLTPGMFAAVTVESGIIQKYLTVPQTAIAFNPYGSSVYVIKTSKAPHKHDADINTAVQVFVTTGETRGDQIAVLSGLKAGEQVVTSGQMKLKNNIQVLINNTKQPLDNPAPSVANQQG